MNRLTKRGLKEKSMTLKILWLIIHTIFLYIAYTICFDDLVIWVDEIFDIDYSFEIDYSKGNIYRKYCLISFGVFMYLRMNLTGLYLLKRKIPIDEFFGVTTAFAAYQIGFVLLGAWQPDPLNVLDVFGVLLFIIGSYFNTYSEIQRNRFKNDPNNKGKLYTQGLFKYAKHINYFGDVCWVTGWAIITHNLWAGIVPIMLTLGFIFFGIPELSSYLEKKYGDDYQEWSKDTKKLIPFIY